MKTTIKWMNLIFQCYSELLFFSLFFRIPVVDIRGDDLSETEEESDDEDFLSFETEDDTSGLDYDIYDFTSLYDTNSDDDDKTVSSRKRRR